MTKTSTATAAQIAKVTARTIRRWIATGKVIATKVARRWVIDAASLRAHVARREGHTTTATMNLTLNQARAKGFRPQTWAAGELIDLTGSTGEITVYESAGTVQGIGEVFFYTRLRRNDSTGRVDGISSEGVKVVSYSRDYRLRILVS
ncbi:MULTISPECIES: helix-turn-helix domain-containing protein [unclassified Nocardiopsis]|uniref:helix-turn-helix domain-containing protein n=1 Tax=unclassified Nocardiopsis TaxID=2649073 RepID=UPI0013573501|nr:MULTISPECIES: helix-turn-helix domain-containing protein [unclassified Nocardiopsis]